MKSKQLRDALRSIADPAIAEHSKRFFKTAKGEYGEGDRFLGIRVPVLRSHARQYHDLPLKQMLQLLRSPYHEERLCALLIMVLKYTRGGEKQREGIFQHYLKNTTHINNWDLVDSSAHHIVGAHLQDRARDILYSLAASQSLWERRIAIISTLHFIKRQQYDDTLALALRLIDDTHDLIHKAVGWMLREVGNRDIAVEQAYLNEYYQAMPRTMLRYAIEKFPEKQRKAYLYGQV
jgi:3-methyladenine DNA glycosylase AlkD